MGNGMNKVLPGLYVGNYRDSKDAAQLERFGITHIVAIHDAARKLHPDKHYLCVLASDSPGQNLSQFFPLCNDFIHAARLRDGNVLIHCLAGMSRSVTVAVAYIMSVTNLGWKEALKVVKVGRAVANPNLGFQRQLEEFENFRLVDERRRLQERFPSLALAPSDKAQCQRMLLNYQSMIISRDLCEGRCSLGQVCPTGTCRVASKRSPRRKASLKTPPPSGNSSPRMLPATPAQSRHRFSTPCSAPASRSNSRVDLSCAGVDEVPAASAPGPSGCLQRVGSFTNGAVGGRFPNPARPLRTQASTQSLVARADSLRGGPSLQSLNPDFVVTPPSTPRPRNRRS
ncbi:dual specificity protein phosphatase 15-like [Neocloeon triangulifer]|uniref:dual specificity protein phosphatase 15-like n=1 Tax=Neocloeon triangulifer TaxID=2078957 RepID=UPI00286F03F8|nr:dual specificity protein phosphatase 15-like [Neocloeon triangulifer]